MFTTIISDIHIPFQDDKAISEWFRHLTKNKINKVIINGDLIDCYDLSSFDKVPKKGKSFYEEIEETKQFLFELRKRFHGQVIYLEGNHSFRLRKYLMKIAPELYDMVSLDLQTLLELDGFKIDWVPAAETTKFTDNFIEHDGFLIGHFSVVSQKSGYTATKLIEKYGNNIIQGHVHRLGMVYKTMPGKTLIGIEGGCLCDTNPVYMRYPNWQKGFVDLINGEPVLHYLG